MTAIMLLSWALPIAVVAYLVALVSFVSMMRREHGEYWHSIGNPGLWEPNGQTAILKTVFLRQKLPAQIITQHGLWLNLVRIFGGLSAALFVTVLIMIWMGRFNPVG